MATCCVETGIDIRQARSLARAGRLSMEDLLDVLEAQDRRHHLDLETIRRQAGEIERLKDRLERFESASRAPAPTKPPEKHSASYSLAGEEKRHRHRKKKSPGRRPTEVKWTEVERYENVVPEGCKRECQKCWAHLLRKAIRLAMLYPLRQRYQQFLAELLRLYYDAKRAAADQRLGDQERQNRVAEFEGRLAGLCLKYRGNAATSRQTGESEFTNLLTELADLLTAEQLFTFVLEPKVEATNNQMERQLRGPVLERKVGRTSKTPAGADRRSVIVSILETLRANLPAFTFANVIQEVSAWIESGVSLLDKLRDAMQKPESTLAPNTS